MQSVKHTIKTLKNGLRILMIPQAEAATITVLVLSGTGSLAERDREQGLSHFLEHMVFKGTSRYQTPRAIAEAFERIGAISNAFTDRDYTGYYAKGSPAHLGTFVDVLGDIYQHATFPESELAKEKGVIIEEINMYNDMAQHRAGEMLMQLMFGDQPAGRSIGGTKEHVSSFTRDDCLTYRAANYHAANTVVVLTGAFDMKTAYKEVVRVFDKMNSAPIVRRKKTTTSRTTSRAVVLYKAIDQAHLAIGFRSKPLGHPDAVTLSLLATILGRGMSSRLFQALREDLGVAYSVVADQDSFSDHGIFCIMAGVDQTRIDEVVDVISDMLVEIKETRVSSEELSKAQEFSTGMLRLGLESSDDIASFYGTQLMVKGVIKTPDALIKEYMAITPSDILRVARTIFVQKHARIAVVGPYTDTEARAKTICLRL